MELKNNRQDSDCFALKTAYSACWTWITMLEIKVAFDTEMQMLRMHDKVSNVCG